MVHVGCSAQCQPQREHLRTMLSLPSQTLRSFPFPPPFLSLWSWLKDGRPEVCFSSYIQSPCPYFVASSIFPTEIKLLALTL